MISRRRFLKIAGAGAAGIGWGAAPAEAASPVPGLAGSQTVSPEGPRIKETRLLGSTGLRMSDVGCGAINLYNANVLRYAFERGVNHFDTAEGYLNGNSERFVGQALRDVRDKIVLTTKFMVRSAADMSADVFMKRLEASLARLRTDHVDVALLHAADDPARLDNKILQEAFLRMKKEGKARYIGFSTHAPIITLAKAGAPGPWEIVLMTYNHMESAPVEPLIVEARQKGVGLIAMKILAGGMQGSLAPLVNEKTHYAQAAIRWALGNPRMDACIISMSSFSHVDEYVAASGMPLQRGDQDVLARYKDEAGPFYCRVSCRACLAACPRGVAVNEVLRFGMYYEHYGMEKTAMGFYGELESSRRPERCAVCEAPCEAACPYGLSVRENLLRARAWLSP